MKGRLKFMYVASVAAFLYLVYAFVDIVIHLVKTSSWAGAVAMGILSIVIVGVLAKQLINNRHMMLK